jgi:enoyl-CoA hydratase
MNYEHLRVEIDQGIAVVTFDRPPVNALNRQSRDELTEAFDTLSDHPDVRCVVLTAAGKFFSAGADIKERAGFAGSPGHYIRHNRMTREFFYAISDCTKPVISAVNGPAMGAGFVMMLASDIMYAAEDAWFVMPEIDVGLAGGAGFLMRHFSKSNLRALYFSGRRLPASELWRLGVIQGALPRAQMMDEAMKLAAEIAAKSPIAVAKIKRTLGVIEEMPMREAYRYEQGVTIELSHTEDAREAQRAFVEKRRPVFKGR